MRAGECTNKVIYAKVRGLVGSNIKPVLMNHVIQTLSHHSRMDILLSDHKSLTMELAHILRNSDNGEQLHLPSRGEMRVPFPPPPPRPQRGILIPPPPPPRHASPPLSQGQVLIQPALPFLNVTPPPTPPIHLALPFLAPGALCPHNNSECGEIASDHKECCVCLEPLESVIMVALNPCGHTKICKDCAGALSECPICRTKIEGRLRLFV